jgi:hypothetical protein
MEVHMNNAAAASGIQSRPGFRVTVLPLDKPQPPTPITPAHWLWLGVTLNTINIAPGLPYTEIVSQYTLPATPTATMTVIASLSHMHNIGRKVWVEVVPTNGPSKSAACNPLYDNGNQEVVPLNPTLDLSNKDTLITHCVFNSTQKTVATKGGEEVG